MHCKKCALNFKKGQSEEDPEKRPFFKSLSQPFSARFVNETWHIC